MRKRAGVEIFRPRTGMRRTEWKGVMGLGEEGLRKIGKVCNVWI